MKLDDPIQYLPGVGPKYAEKMQRLGIDSIHDLLFYWPRRYDDFSKPQRISDLRIGDEAIIKAEVQSIKKSYTKRRWMTLIEAELSDGSSTIIAIWYNQPFILNIIKPGNTWLFKGKIIWDFKNKKKVVNISQYEKDPIILPIYSETEGITSKYLRKLIKLILINLNLENNTPGVLSKGLGEYLPKDLLKSEKLIDINEAIKKIHFPTILSDIEIAKHRLAFDELFFISLRMLANKNELSKGHAIALNYDKKILQNFVKELPYKLTNAQRRTAWEIILDLQKNRPMNRLLEGDVGSGKTVVASMAALVAIKAGYQVVWLAPTEILANQHFANVAKLLKQFKFNIGLWTGSNKKTDFQKDNLIIGTHALIQKNIKFGRLALIIIDEQHRFGVKQRAFLRRSDQKNVPHFLSMTATPIPRTLALSFYGDLDLSVIDEMPLERKQVITKAIAPDKRTDAYKFIENQVKTGRQVFVICPLIESKDESILSKNLFDFDRKSVKEEYKKLNEEIFPKLKIGLLHGKMKVKEKDETMEKFKAGKIDILVSTAVIEVGIDIQNASVMMIEGAERFGLAQLHQFRGRVGRSAHQSYCFLFSESWFDVTRKRLNAMTSCNNGFRLAEIDLELRGPGELAGFRQSGIPDLKMATLTDRIMIERAKHAAEVIINKGIEKYPKLRNILQKEINSKN